MMEPEWSLKRDTVRRPDILFIGTIAEALVILRALCTPPRTNPLRGGLPLLTLLSVYHCDIATICSLSFRARSTHKLNTFEIQVDGKLRMRAWFHLHRTLHGQ